MVFAVTAESSLNLADMIIKIAAVLAAVTTITAFFGKIFKMTSQTYEAVKKLREHTLENYMSTLRLTVISEEMPIEERLNAGEKYISLGGNGAIKCRYQQLQKEYLKDR